MVVNRDSRLLKWLNVMYDVNVGFERGKKKNGELGELGELGGMGGMGGIGRKRQYGRYGRKGGGSN